MKFVKQSVKIIEQGYSIKDMLAHIEKCGRVCYKSEDKITDGSAAEFVHMLIKRGHTSVLEHGSVYLKLKWYHIYYMIFFLLNPYSKISGRYVSTNYRVIVQNNLDDLMMKTWSNLTSHHKERITTHWICDRGISHELVRERVFSFSQESTRYCNYTKGSESNTGEITYIWPYWFDLDEGICKRVQAKLYTGKKGRPSNIYVYKIFNEDGNIHEITHISALKFLEVCYLSEKMYNSLVRDGYAPQKARAVLPNALKTELYITGFKDYYTQCEHYNSKGKFLAHSGLFERRSHHSAHPQMRDLVIDLSYQFTKRDKNRNCC